MPLDAIAALTPRVTIIRQYQPSNKPKQVAHHSIGPASNTRSAMCSRQHALTTMEHNLAMANETVANAWNELACTAVMDVRPMVQYQYSLL